MRQPSLPRPYMYVARARSKASPSASMRTYSTVTSALIGLSGCTVSVGTSLRT